jgi:hypothetical protein
VLLKLRSLDERLHLTLRLLFDVVERLSGELLDTLVMGDVFLHESPHQPSTLDIAGSESHGVIVVRGLLLSVLDPDSAIELIAYLNNLHLLGYVGSVDLEAGWHFCLQRIEALEDVLETSLYLNDLSIQGIEAGSSAHDEVRDLDACKLSDIAIAHHMLRNIPGVTRGSALGILLVEVEVRVLEGRSDRRGIWVEKEREQELWRRTKKLCSHEVWLYTSRNFPIGRQRRGKHDESSSFHCI